MKPVLICLLAILFCQTSGHPQFADYLVPIRFHQKPARIDLTSHADAQKFRTVLREAQKNGPNFADHYTLVRWGCGTNCIAVAIVDARTGKVWFPVKPACFDVAFRRDSRLLVIDPIDSLAYASSGNHAPLDVLTRYYVWDSGSLVQIDSCNTPSDLKFERTE